LEEPPFASAPLCSCPPLLVPPFAHTVFAAARRLAEQARRASAFEFTAADPVTGLLICEDSGRGKRAPKTKQVFSPDDENYTPRRAYVAPPPPKPPPKSSRPPPRPSTLPAEKPAQPAARITIPKHQPLTGFQSITVHVKMQKACLSPTLSRPPPAIIATSATTPKSITIPGQLERQLTSPTTPRLLHSPSGVKGLEGPLSNPTKTTWTEIAEDINLDECQYIDPDLRSLDSWKQGRDCKGIRGVVVSKSKKTSSRIMNSLNDPIFGTRVFHAKVQHNGNIINLGTQHKSRSSAECRVDVADVYLKGPMWATR